MSFMAKLFSPAAPPSTVPTVPAPAQQLQVTPGNIPEGTGVAPATVTDPVTKPPEDNSPLDEYKDLWDTLPDTGATDSNLPETLDPAKLQEAVSKADFSGAITAENRAKIVEGGEAAMQATVDSMNAMSQQVFMQSALASNKMLEQAMEKMQASQEAAIANIVKQQATTDQVAKTNPIFSNPAVRPVIDAVQSQLAAKYPEASPTELATMANKFVTVMGEALSPNLTVTSSQVPAGEDFSNFLL